MSERTSVARQARRGLRCGILAVFAVGLRRKRPGAVFNAVLALLGTRLPGTLERRFDVVFEPWQRVYLDLAMLNHAVGMLGPYDEIWWWDHVTHTHSATILGGLLHVVAVRNDRDPDLPVIGGVLFAGVLWEIAEYLIHQAARVTGQEPLLVNYGRNDTLLDLWFDLVGALVVVVFGRRLLGDELTEGTREL